MSDWNEKIIEEFRAHGGKVGGMFEGRPLLLLTTTGARTGRRHTTPVMYLRDDERVLVFASNAGATSHPAWYHNLLARSEVTVEIGDGTLVETYTANARPLHGEERDRVYAHQSELEPAFVTYQAGTSRVIPVVELHRRDEARAQALGDELVRIHDGLRRDLAALLAEIEDSAEGAGPPTDTPALAPDLRQRLHRHCLDFCEAIHAHHTTESERGFPLLERRFPELAPAIERLRLEHVVVERIREDVQRALGELANGDTRKVLAELQRLAAELEAHFDHEERRLVAALNAL